MHLTFFLSTKQTNRFVLLTSNNYTILLFWA